MLFLYRPRETWMPYSLPRNRTDQAAYNRSMQQQFASTRRVPPAPPKRDPEPDPESQLAELRDQGILTSAEYEAALERLRGA